VVSVNTVEKQDCTERHTSEKSEATESGHLGGMVVVRTRIVGGVATPHGVATVSSRPVKNQIWLLIGGGFFAFAKSGELVCERNASNRECKKLCLPKIPSEANTFEISDIHC
jgi:hypothetical protein